MPRGTLTRAPDSRNPPLAMACVAGDVADGSGVKPGSSPSQHG